MVTDAMIEAGAAVIEQKARFFDEEALAEMVYEAMHAARPTADLGEDGELVERLRDIAALMRASTRFVSCVERMEQAADRLILYREARDQVEQVISAWAFAHNIDGAARNDLFERLRSRSGG